MSCCDNLEFCIYVGKSFDGSNFARGRMFLVRIVLDVDVNSFQ